MSKKVLHLIPLSWEHRHGLVLVWRIRRGLDRGVDPRIIAAYLLHFWEIAVNPHFETEETVLLPEMSEGDPVLEKVRRDHQAVRKRVESLRKKEPYPEEIVRSLRLFADALERHIRFEEREVFPLAEKTISPESLQRLKVVLHERFRNVEDDWRPVFWEAG